MKILKKFIMRQIAGENMLIPTGETTQEFNGMITMSETAKFIWENVESCESLDELVQRILDEFDVDEELAHKDAAGLIGELVQAGIMGCSREDGTW